MSEVTNHGARAHSRIGPSSMGRTLSCPGWVGFCADLKDKGSVFAREGTAAHMFCEHILSTGESCSDYLDGVVDISGDTAKQQFFKTGQGPKADREDCFEIDNEMVEGAELYVETIQTYLGEFVGDDSFEFEARLDMTHIHPLLFGTGDVLIYKAANRHLVVMDYKYGRGYAVEVEDNPQLLTYAVGAAHKLQNRGVDKVTLVVVQPRAFHRNGPVRVAEVTAAGLAEFVEVLRAGTARTEAEAPGFVAGEHCGFCPGAALCGTLRDKVVEITGASLGENGEMIMPVAEKMTPDELGTLVQNSAIVERWFKRAMQYGHDQALSGNLPTGTKLVEKRTFRKWIDADSVVEMFEILGYDESTYMSEPELLSPSKVEKALGRKESAKVLAGLVGKTGGGLVMALIDDPRKAKNPSDGDEFGAPAQD